MMTINHKQKFLLPELDIRGVVVGLSSSWQELLSRRQYSPEISELLGEVTAASLLISSHIKFDGQLILQLQTEGQLKLVVAQCNNKNNFRSLVNCDDTKSEQQIATQNATLMINIEAKKGENPYQGIVSIQSEKVADNLETYFSQSEQIKTLIVLRANQNFACGIMLQALPDCSANEDDWQRLALIIQTLDAQEFSTLDTQTLLERIFAEDDKILYPAEPAQFFCACSDERTLGMLANLPNEELNDMANSNSDITIGCDFCGKQYIHDAKTLAALVQNKRYPN